MSELQVKILKVALLKEQAKSRKIKDDESFHQFGERPTTSSKQLEKDQRSLKQSSALKSNLMRTSGASISTSSSDSKPDLKLQSELMAVKKMLNEKE